ncbi:hypothetical protein ACPA9J_25730 [Pseudomonas aeruginosa]
MCPAFAAGQPLNPKKLIQDMVIGLAGGNDAKFAGDPYPGKPLGEHGGGPHQPIVALDGKALVDADTPVVLHHLPGLRRGVPDDDRARRRHRRHAPPPDPGRRRHAEQGRRGAGQPDRHRQPRRLRPPAAG